MPRVKRGPALPTSVLKRRAPFRRADAAGRAMVDCKLLLSALSPAATPNAATPAGEYALGRFGLRKHAKIAGVCFRAAEEVRQRAQRV